MAVFVLDRRKKPLMPCPEKRARLLLERQKAVVHKIAPFTPRLRKRVGGEGQPVRIKLGPLHWSGKKCLRPKQPPASCFWRNQDTGAVGSGSVLPPGERSGDEEGAIFNTGKPGRRARSTRRPHERFREKVSRDTPQFRGNRGPDDQTTGA